MIVPSVVLDFARRQPQPFIYGPRRASEWPIQAIPTHGFHLLFLDPQVALALYGDDDAAKCAGGLVAALGDLCPLPFEDGDGCELGTLLTYPFGDVEVLALFGPLTYLSWYLRAERTGFYLRLPEPDATVPGAVCR